MKRFKNKDLKKWAKAAIKNLYDISTYKAALVKIEPTGPVCYLFPKEGADIYKVVFTMVSKGKVVVGGNAIHIKGKKQVATKTFVINKGSVST